MRIAFLLLMAALVVQPVLAEEANPPPFNVDSLTALPGVEISRQKDGSGTITVWTRNNVSVTRRVDGSRTTVWGNDQSGKGAVLCSWMIDVEIRAILEACPGRFLELKNDLDQGIATIDSFVVANSYSPITLDAMHAQEAGRYAAIRNRAQANAGDAEKLCMQGDPGRMISSMNEASQAQRRQAVADLLSIPRWPVSNPCL